MPSLSRTGRLLRMVNGKEHASEADHEDGRNSRSSSSLSDVPSGAVDEDVAREPESSSAEEEPKYVPSVRAAVRAPRRHGGKENYSNIHAAPKEEPAGEEAKNGEPPASSGFKRPAGSGEDWVIQSSQEKKPRMGYGSSSQRAKARKTFVQPSKNSKDLRSPEAPKSKFQPPPKVPAAFSLTADSSSQPEPASQSTGRFKRPGGYDAAAAHTPLSPHSEDATHPSPLLSLLSSPPSEVEVIDIPDSSMNATTSTCPLCGEKVEASFKQEFEDEVTHGKRMNLRMQERFCRAHKARHSDQFWRDHGYPEIEWHSLQKRMKRHHTHIMKILDGSVSSRYRDDLEEKVRSGQTKTVLHTYHTDTASASGASVGYYGSRGEKMMTTSILQAFSSKLRRLASSDTLIAAKGVSGGVSGYVHSVLVPELAISLIREDMGVDANRAREIIDESADIGELLNGEEEEKVPRALEATQASYGAEDADGARGRQVVLDV